MKKLLAICLTFALLLPCLALSESTPSVADGATITVTGSATVTLKADYARISVGVSTTDKTVEAAAQQNNAAIHTVIEALKEAGVDEKDIATSNYSVHAEYDYSSFAGQKLTGYNVTNQLTVVIRDMDHIGATLDKATAAGANNIYNIDFLSTKADEAQDEAITYAVQDAMRRAKLLASAAGLQLGGIVSISDSTASWNLNTRTYASKLEMDTVGNSIIPDDTAVSASVTMVFELR
ncbi:MAG: SIMPL domain-containing protein [Clostridiales bacterium]|nr:SIMPL domain-containing protein [Clostridiales bacterium]